MNNKNEIVETIKMIQEQNTNQYQNEVSKVVNVTVNKQDVKS